MPLTSTATGLSLPTHRVESITLVDAPVLGAAGNMRYGAPGMRRDDYLERILRARVYDVAEESPLEPAPLLSKRLGNLLLLKREDLQSVFSFKLRGAYNKMAGLTPPAREGVIARPPAPRARAPRPQRARLPRRNRHTGDARIKVNAVRRAAPGWSRGDCTTGVRRDAPPRAATARVGVSRRGPDVIADRAPSAWGSCASSPGSGRSWYRSRRCGSSSPASALRKRPPSIRRRRRPVDAAAMTPSLRARRRVRPTRWASSPTAPR
jgi:hypothetical protein